MVKFCNIKRMLSMGEVKRIYVEKRPPYAVEAAGAFDDLVKNLLITEIKGIRLFNRYDVEGITDEVFNSAKNIIFSEPMADVTYKELPLINEVHRVFAIEYLPGQFDQRADSCAQCISLLTQKENPIVRTAKVFILIGKLSDLRLEKIKSYLINPVESRDASLDTFESLEDIFEIPSDIEILEGFIDLDKNGLKDFIIEYGLAMDLDDIKFCQNYFKKTEKRNPTITEIRMLDTYWSDHCRHTTFLTNIDRVEIEPNYIKDAFEMYLESREYVYGGKRKHFCLMDIATIAMKTLKKEGKLKDLDESEEINACSVKVKAKVNGKDEDWLLMFKNETHNHPTEIEPFGGAATCLGGAIRDPLSGRAYVYQAMRVTGAADPRQPVEETMHGKLPQKKITVAAAHGYSSYGNQIGLATGLVNEIYHPGYVAKRLEIGAVIGAAPAKNVIREAPVEGDVVILLGGRTGRDGIGGATGSSKSHTKESIETCGAEVQKGNPPEERKIQRLFRNPEATRLIKRCNDFGAGGVCVAIGELADGLTINLNAIPKKYESLDGTELAISESQERMAVVVSQEDSSKFIELAESENLEATLVAQVTLEPRLKMEWNGKTIVNITREFLDSNGAEKYAQVNIKERDLSNLLNINNSKGSVKERWLNTVSNLNCCSQKGLAERFDSTIGASTVLMPFGGRKQLTPIQAMAAKLPVLNGDTDTCSVMSYGFNPYLSEKSPFHGAVFAVVESVSKLVASGCSHKSAWLTLQEYFERTKNDAIRWGKPFEALLGAMYAQLKLDIGAIGGKDSMSGTYEEIDVPPTLVSFAVSVSDEKRIISPEFKKAGSAVVLFRPEFDENMLFNFEALKKMYAKIEKLTDEGKVLSACVVTGGGLCEAVSKMCFGNNIGFEFSDDFDINRAFSYDCGAVLIETNDKTVGEVIGFTADEPAISFDNEKISLDEILREWEAPLEEVFPVNAKGAQGRTESFTFNERNKKAPAIKLHKPKVVIPVFPGTNCEYDSARAFKKAGAECEIIVIRNLTADMINQSVAAFSKAVKESQIIMIPGGFSAGDEPDGSGKFIATFFRNPFIKDAVTELLQKRDGLILGICNGFQALIKLGLVPFGEIRDLDENCPTLTYNAIGRHQSMLTNTRVASVKSPWLSLVNTGDIYTVPISHGEGRFVAGEELIKKLALNGQIAAQYVDAEGNPTMDIRFNPNSSMYAIEGITSPDGRVFGKMAHNERIDDTIAKNVQGNKDMKIFEAGVKYFR